MRVFGLFAGVGGLERGLSEAGHSTLALCEIDAVAGAVLQRRFPRIALHTDVRKLDALDGAELLTAGFPCQDLSQAGNMDGIAGKRSGLVRRVFHLLGRQAVPWVLLENVPNMLHLDRGAAMGFLTSRFERLGYRWAYRVLDTRAFGLPQRRRRVFFLASTVADPAPVLLGSRGEFRWPADDFSSRNRSNGFYWTEGNRGLGWSAESVPPLKGGSGWGIPSAPAVWFRAPGRGPAFVTPSIQDAERLQGLPSDWTEQDLSESGRWRLVGNAVSVPVARWIGDRLGAAEAGKLDAEPNSALRLSPGDRWPDAAWGTADRRFAVDVGPAPALDVGNQLLSRFLQRSTAKPLSVRAASGFLRRLLASNLQSPQEFRTALVEHIEAMRYAAIA